MSQEGGSAQSGGVCDHLGSAGSAAGTGSLLSDLSHLAGPCREAFPQQPGLLQTPPGKNTTDGSGHRTGLDAKAMSSDHEVW